MINNFVYFSSALTLSIHNKPTSKTVETEADFYLWFGLSVNRIHNKEEPNIRIGNRRGPPYGAPFSTIYFLGNTTYSREGYQGQKKCF